jgi:hypothetical protein
MFTFYFFFEVIFFDLSYIFVKNNVDIKLLNQIDT